MVHKAKDSTENLLPAATEVFPRYEADYKDNSRSFSQELSDFSKQFAHVYAARLVELREVLLEKVQNTWNNVPVIRLSELEEFEGKECVIIGTLYKHQQWKPSILRELSDDHQLVPPEPRPNYCCEKDQCFLEDDMLRIKILGEAVNPSEIITGIVCGILGHENEDGTFQVKDWCFPGCVPQPKKLKDDVSKGKILLLSGLDMSKHGTSLSLSLLTEWICGLAGNSTVNQLEASIVRVIIAGNSTKASSESHTSREGLSEGKDQDEASSKALFSATQKLDAFLEGLVQSCAVTLMPGEHDPTNLMLPQRPFHPLLFKQASRYENMSCVSNPWMGTIGNRLVIGSSGQSIEDILKASGSTEISPIEWLARTLIWRQLSPTAPDTLPSYPFTQKDLFIMKSCPDIYFVGNTDKFETKLWRGEEDQVVRLISIPKFAESKTAVLVNLENLDVETISFGSG